MKNRLNQKRLWIVSVCLAAQLSAPTTAWAHGGLAEALLLAGFVVHLIATLVLTFIGTMIFGKNRKLKVFFLSFVTSFFAEFPVMFIPMVLPWIGDSGFIGSYMITIIAVALFFPALYGGAFKKRPPAPDPISAD